MRYQCESRYKLSCTTQRSQGLRAFDGSGDPGSGHGARYKRVLLHALVDLLEDITGSELTKGEGTTETRETIRGIIILFVHSLGSPAKSSTVSPPHCYVRSVDRGLSPKREVNRIFDKQVPVFRHNHVVNIGVSS